MSFQLIWLLVYFVLLNTKIMKKGMFFMLLFLAVISMVFESCGPVIVSARTSAPPPPWFYPNRVETVRYVYFPDYMIYYDLSLRNYIYLENGVWITVNVLPARYSRVNLRRSRFVRINNYYGDDIKRYHNENSVRGRSNRRSTGTRNNN